MPKLLTSAPPAMLLSGNSLALDLREDSGQSIIELALVLPVFFILMIGFINFCMVIFGFSNIAFVCRQADRYACLHSQTSLLPVTQSTIDALVAPYIFKYPSNSYTDTLSNGTNAVGGTATVTVKITYKIVLPFVSIPTTTLSSTASGTITQ